ncbi:Nucleotide-diphospho-sugar transferase [Sesbania bispinosa]|nr:Nucleotide-diphospho-sugar transferase [Sesbania bispinosa]
MWHMRLWYGDEFLLGVRVLGKSIRDTGSNKDMVALVSDGVSDYANNLLQADGWIVEKISLLANPNQVRPKRFWGGVYTKLKIFNMTNYKKGDQGFLNSYYSGFPNAHVFEPSFTPEMLDTRPVPEMERLSTLYNADVGLYMLANKWMVDENELRVIHYTLGPLKPWDWWTSWLLKPVDVWQNVREQLEESLPGTGGGRNPKDDFLVKFLFLLPFVAVLFCCYRSFLKDTLVPVVEAHYVIMSDTFTIGLNQVAHLHILAFLLLLSIPPISGVSWTSSLDSTSTRQVTPWTGLLLMYEWTFTIFFILFGGYLNLIYHWGKIMASRAPSSLSHPGSSDDDSGKGHQRQIPSCDAATWFYGLGMAFLAIVAPSLPCLFGITALFLR